MNPDKLKKLQNQVRTGGKGTVRRKKKAARKAVATDDKKLQVSLKRLGCNPLPGIEEVTMFNIDGSVRIFKNPKVQVAVNANTYVVSGHSEVKDIKDFLPADLNVPKTGTVEDDVPELVDVNFEEVATSNKQ